jgi:hypothetical protein
MKNVIAGLNQLLAYKARCQGIEVEDEDEEMDHQVTSSPPRRWVGIDR